jgi:hypothetical protein
MSLGPCHGQLATHLHVLTSDPPPPPPSHPDSLSLMAAVRIIFLFPFGWFPVLRFLIEILELHSLLCFVGYP